jgi:hypothetical protein
MTIEHTSRPWELRFFFNGELRFTKGFESQDEAEKIGNKYRETGLFESTFPISGYVIRLMGPERRECRTWTVPERKDRNEHPPLQNPIHNAT